MMSLTSLFLLALLTWQTPSVTEGQQVEGRHLRLNVEKCDRQSGCIRVGYNDGSDERYLKSDDMKPPLVDTYRSIASGSYLNTGERFKHDSDENLKPSADDYEGKPLVGSDRRPTSGDKDFRVPIGHYDRGDGDYNRKPISDGADYAPKLEKDSPSPHIPKQDSPRPISGGGYNSKPIGGGYNPRPVIMKDHGIGVDEYLPKPERDGGSTIGGSGYNSKPVRGGGYNPRPVPKEDHGLGEHGYLPKPENDGGPLDGGGGYNPKPIRGGYGGSNPRPVPKDHGLGVDGYLPIPKEDEYRPRPHVDIDPLPKPNPGSGYRPKPVIDSDYDRPTGDGGYYKPGGQNSRPDDPYYLNKDLGGYHDPKDKDYSDEEVPGINIKDDDYTSDVKPVPLVKGGNCICVPYYQCQDGHIVTDGSGIIDARKRPEPEEELPLDGKFNPPSCGPFHVCCNTPETSTVKPYEHRCGVRNPSGINSRILSPSNKGEADFGEWPWQAAVLKSEGKINIFMCGGVLIDKLHVLTVAHCVFHLYKLNEYPLKVRLGEWDTQTTSEFLAHEDYMVSKIVVHPDYKNTSLWNDVAILRLEEPVLFAPHIDTVCLPKYDEIFAEQNCVVTGWGKDAYKGGTFSNIMKEVALQVIDNYKCEEMLRKTRLGRFFQLHEGFLCAGGEYGLDSCKGDGGGPLVCYRKDKSYALAGLVSWGIDCGQPGVPGVYVKIQKYLEWISKNTGVALQDYMPKH